MTIDYNCTTQRLPLYAVGAPESHYTVILLHCQQPMLSSATAHACRIWQFLTLELIRVMTSYETSYVVGN